MVILIYKVVYVIFVLNNCYGEDEDDCVSDYVVLLVYLLLFCFRIIVELFEEE